MEIFSEICFGGGGRQTQGSEQRSDERSQSYAPAVTITFEEAVFGCEKELELNLKDECTTCHGTGAKPGTSPETCPKCGGKGQVVYTQQSLVRYGTKCTDLSGLSAVPVRSSKRSVRTAVVQGIPAARKKIAGQRSRPVSMTVRASGSVKKVSRESTEVPRGDLLVEVNVQPATRYLPASGYEYLLHSTAFPLHRQRWAVMCGSRR